MVAEKSTRRSTSKLGPKRAGNAAPEAEPTPERRYVDVDPWAVLLEGLMDMPEEVPAERKRPKGK